MVWVKYSCPKVGISGRLVIELLEKRWSTPICCIKKVTCCAPCIKVSIPAKPRRNLSYRAIVELDAEVYSLTVIRKSEEDYVSSRRSCVLSSYALNVATGQSSSFSRRVGKNNLSMA